MHKYLTIACFFITILTLAQGSTDDAKIANEYYVQGDLEKAEELFSTLSKNKALIPQIHSNYLDLLHNKQDWKTIEKYLDRVIKFYPNDLQYEVDFIYLYDQSGQETDKKIKVAELLKQYGPNQYQLNLLAQSCVSHGLQADAIAFLMHARSASGNPRSFALDLAAVYRAQGDKPNMTREYLNYAMSNPNNLNYVKNLFQALLTEEEDLDNLERLLIQLIQEDPDRLEYSELLIWVSLQRKNFYGAFLQARAIDQRTGKPGDRCMEIAAIAMDHRAWSDAIDIYEYVIGKYEKQRNYAQARQLLIRSKEGSVTDRFPIDQEALKQLTNEYWYFYQEIGPSAVSLDALLNKARIHAFYLDEKDTAIALLNYMISIPRLGSSLAADIKLTLADIYLLDDNPWEASLLYSQVEKANKYSEIGYEAKLRNAKLHYYTGNFMLSKAHLDILKRSTTKEISNDAINLSLLIDNNSVLDTSDYQLKQYAQAELLIYQHKYEEAENVLNSLMEETPDHSLVDECLWLLADISFTQGDFPGAISSLDKLITSFHYDVLGDDALFRKAMILQQYMHDDDQAQELYREFLTKYPGSMYAAEARKRFRQLRGDLVN